MKRILVLVIAILFSVNITACTEKDMDYSLSEIEPYINHLGDVLDGTTLILSEEEQNNINTVSIADIEGAVSYSVSGIGNVFNVAGRLTWSTNESDYSSKEFEKINQIIEKVYALDDEEGMVNENIREWKDVNEFSRIVTMKTEEENKIEVLWDYNTDTLFTKEEIAGCAAIKLLTDRLKNPESLQLHSVAYAENVFGTDSENCIGIKIDYSAQNGFGGYNREDFYILLNPDNQYSQENTFLEASSYMSGDFIELDAEKIGKLIK